MIKIETPREARQWAILLHAGDVDKAGVPYVRHLEAVAKGVQVLGGSDEEQIAAWFHDVVEDGHTTLERLRQNGVPEESLEIIDAVSKRPGESWRLNLNRVIDAGPGAMRVKVADLLHNTRHDRVEALREIQSPEQIEARMKRYRRSLAILLAELGLVA